MDLKTKKLKFVLKNMSTMPPLLSWFCRFEYIVLQLMTTCDQCCTQTQILVIVGVGNVLWNSYTLTYLSIQKMYFVIRLLYCATVFDIMWNNLSLFKKRKNFMALGENVWERVSGRQWKGRGIDGRISPRTGASERIALVHDAGTRPHCVWWGSGVLACFEMALGGS